MLEMMLRRELSEEVPHWCRSARENLGLVEVSAQTRLPEGSVIVPAQTPTSLTAGQGKMQCS